MEPFAQVNTEYSIVALLTFICQRSRLQPPTHLRCSRPFMTMPEISLLYHQYMQDLENDPAYCEYIPTWVNKVLQCNFWEYRNLILLCEPFFYSRVTFYVNKLCFNVNLFIFIKTFSIPPIPRQDTRNLNFSTFEMSGHRYMINNSNTLSLFVIYNALLK